MNCTEFAAIRVKAVIGRKFINTKTQLKTTVNETFDALSE